MNPKAQSLEQTVSIIKVFSAADHIIFLPWQTETMSVLKNSGILKEFWPPLLLKFISHPAISKITAASKDSKD